MVWQQALYLVNLLCKFVPCDYNFPYPDTSLSEQQEFKSQITLGFGGTDTGQLDSVGVGLDGWGKHHNPTWVKEHEYTNSDPLVVVTKTGKLRGYWMKVVGGRKIRAFEGIPYSEPPVGHFRFNVLRNTHHLNLSFQFEGRKMVPNIIIKICVGTFTEDSMEWVTARGQKRSQVSSDRPVGIA